MRNGNKKINKIVIIGLAIVILLCVGFGTVYLIKLKKQKKTTDQHQAEELLKEVLAQETPNITKDPNTAKDPNITEPPNTANIENKMNERELYTVFLKEKILPEYGLSRLGEISLECMWYDGGIDLKEYLPDEKKGVIGADIEDLNQDGIQEMIVVCADTFPVLSGSDAYDYDGVRVLVYSIEEGEVISVKMPQYVSEFPYTFAYGSNEVMNVVVQEYQREKYIVLYEKCDYITELSTESVSVIVLKMNGQAMECLKYLVVKDGYVLDQKEIIDTELDTVLYYDYRGVSETEKNYNSIYEAFSGELQPFGLSFFGMKKYFEQASYDEDLDLVDFQKIEDQESFFPSLEVLEPDVNVLVTILQTCEDNKQKIEIRDKSNLRAWLGIEEAPYGKVREYKRLTYVTE